MTKVLKQFTGYEGNTEEEVNDFIEEQGILNYEVAGYNTVIDPETKNIFTSILIKYEEYDTKDYLDKDLEAFKKPLKY